MKDLTLNEISEEILKLIHQTFDLLITYSSDIPATNNLFQTVNSSNEVLSAI